MGSAGKSTGGWRKGYGRKRGEGDTTQIHMSNRENVKGHKRKGRALSYPLCQCMYVCACVCPSVQTYCIHVASEFSLQLCNCNENYCSSDI